MKDHLEKLTDECRRLVDQIYDIHFDFEEERRDDLIRLGLDITNDLPEYHALFSALSSIIMDKEDISEQPEILEAMKTAYRHAPDDHYILTFYAACLFYSGQISKAKTLTEKALTISPDFRPALQLAGMIQIKAGSFTKSINYFQKISSLKENDFRAMSLVSDCLATLGHHNEAMDNDKMMFDTGLVYICSHHPVLALLKVSPDMGLPFIYDQAKDINVFRPYSDLRVLEAQLVKHDPHLKTLDLSFCNASSLDICHNPELEWLDVTCTCLYRLDVSGHRHLRQVACIDALLRHLDLTGADALIYLDADQNELTSLDISTNRALTYLSLANNRLAGLDTEANTVLETLYLFNNDLTTIDLSSNALLKELNVSENGLSALDVSTNNRLVNIHADNNKMTKIILESKPQLTLLDISHNQLPDIDLSGCSSLLNLDISHNRLSKLDIAQNQTLTVIDASNNQLREFAGGHQDLIFLDLSNNKLQSVNLKDKPGLVALDLSFNPLTQLEYGHAEPDSLHYLSVFGCRLPLSNLTKLARPWMRAIQFGIQINVFFEYRTIDSALGANLDLSGEASINNIETQFFILDEHGREVSAEYFSEEAGVFNFTVAGKYRVLMMNRSIPAFTILPDSDNEFYSPGESSRETFPSDIFTRYPEFSDQYWHYYGHTAEDTPKQELYVRHPDIMKILDNPFEVRIDQKHIDDAAITNCSRARLSPEEIQEFNSVWPESKPNTELIHYHGFLMYLRGARQYDELSYARAYTGLIEVI